MKNERSLFWDRAKVILKEKKITKKELAEGIGMSVNTIDTQIKRGISPRLEYAYSIADYLDVPTEDLLYDKTSKSDTDRFLKEFESARIESQIRMGEMRRNTIEKAKEKVDFQDLFENFKKIVLDLKFNPQMTLDDFLIQYNLNDLIVYTEMIKEKKIYD